MEEKTERQSIVFYLVSAVFLVAVGRFFWDHFSWAHNFLFIFFGLPIICAVFFVPVWFLLTEKLLKNPKNLLANNKYFVRFLRFLYVFILWVAAAYLLSLFLDITKSVGIATFLFIFASTYDNFGRETLVIKKMDNFIDEINGKVISTTIFLSYVLFLTTIITLFIVGFLTGRI